jgi:phosphate transport system permease protein
MAVIDLRPDHDVDDIEVLPDEPIVAVRKITSEEILTWVSAAVASLALTWLVYERLTPFSGGLGFLVCWWVVFTVMAYALARVQWGAVRALDQMVRVLITSAALIALVPLVAVIFAIFSKGYHALRWGFLVHDMGATSSSAPISQGGVGHAILGTLEIVGLAALISVPLGILTAVYLNEVRGVLARPVRMLTDAMSAIPSIVCGLFIFATLILSGVLQFSGFAGALALSILMLPTVTRTTEVVLRLVPGGLREASLSLGGSEWRTTRDVVLPTARSGLVTSAILGVARVVGETAPLLFTIFGAYVYNKNPFSGRQEALPHLIYTQYVLSTGPNTPADLRVWSGAFVLLALVLVVFIAARFPRSRLYVLFGTAATFFSLWLFQSTAAAVAIPCTLVIVAASFVLAYYVERSRRAARAAKGVVV